MLAGHTLEEIETMPRSLLATIQHILGESTK